MEFTELFSLLEARKSCRSFQSEVPLKLEEIKMIIKAGQQAPNPLNQQPWSFVVITADEIKKKLRQAGEKAKQTVLDKGGPGWVGGFSIDFMEEAPLVIAVLVDPRKGGLGDYFNQPIGSIQAGSACLQNMMLAATTLGFGTLWFTFFDPAEVRPIIAVPENLEIVGLLFVGKAVGDVPASRRRAPVIYSVSFGVEYEQG
ncbi:MAG: nitroreductase family protein [Pseudomonadota bacterium]|nr:nitroreductase family protein [Pseudomonadota bacterium]